MSEMTRRLLRREMDQCRLCRIDVEHLGVVRDGQVLLSDVNLHIHCGELTALIGANGAGKTTLLRALLGQIEHTGSVHHVRGDGREVGAPRPLKGPGDALPRFFCSGGELQRVLLALALEPQPDLLILDEPVSGVDSNGLDDFYRIVSDLRRHQHLAILLVSHDLDVVRRYADRVVLVQGTVIAQGRPQAVFASEAFRQVFYSKEAVEE